MQKSLQGLNNVTAEGTEAIDNLTKMLETLVENGATCGPVLAHAKSRGPELSEKELGFGQIVFVKLSNSYQNPFKLGFRF